MEKEITKTLYRFIASQTVANESFEHSLEYITEVFKINLNTKYKERFTANRQLKKKFTEMYNAELKAFNLSCKKYLKANKKMLLHFDAWNNEKSEENIDKVYEILD